MEINLKFDFTQSKLFRIFIFTIILAGVAVAGNVYVKEGEVIADTNMTANYFVGDGSQLTGIGISMLNGGEGSELTISSGEITITQTYHKVDTEGDLGTDNLDTINGGTIGDIIILQPASGDRTVRILDQTGNIWLGGNEDLNDIRDTITLLYDGSYWIGISDRDNRA